MKTSTPRKTAVRASVAVAAGTLFSVLPLTAAIAAAAQDGAHKSLLAIEEVTVTAQKRKERLVDVPVAVNLVSDNLIDSEMIASVESLSRVAPSLNFNNDNIGIRGMGSVGFSVQVEPTVAFAVDGVVMTRSAQAFFDLIDVERVEVLRGPQGTLFGKNASAGLVNIVTKGPTTSFSASAETQLVQGGDALSKLSLSGPISDRVQGRISVAQKERDGFIENATTGERVNGEDATSIRVQLAAQLNESLDASFSAYQLEREIDGHELQWREVSDPMLAALMDAYGVAPGARSTKSFASGTDREVREEEGAHLNVDWQFAGEHTLTSVTAYSQWQMDKSDDVDEQPVALREPLYLSPLPTPLGSLGPINFDQFVLQDIEQYSQEIRFTSPVDEKFSYILGAYGSRYELDDTTRREFDFCTYPAVLGLPIEPTLSGVAPGSPCFDPAGDIVSLSTASVLMGLPEVDGKPALTLAGLNRNVQGENYALFGQGTLAFADDLELRAGLRYQYDSTELDFAVTEANPLPGFGFGEASAASQQDTVSGSALSGKISLQKQFADDLMGYVSYARGYKGPTGEVRSSLIASNAASAVQAIDPETSDNIELGVKGALGNGRGYWAATVFRSEYADYQAEQFSGADQQFVLANVGEVRTQGVELEGAWKPADGFTFDMAITYLDAEIQHYPRAKCYVPEMEDSACTDSAPYSKNLAGGELPMAPEWKAYAGGRYERVLAGTDLLTFAQLSYSWQGDVQFNLDQNPRTVQEAYGIWNASVGFGTADGRYLVTMFGRNLLGENHVTSMFQDFITGYSANIVQYRPQEADRLLGVSLRANF
ncbi:TonB-dependent receptor [uncultured Microbulbifer sp.]|uniref:TonB-dependent receptor n=1 Tax=uncultured Microbulbifer sp. TaxID=348147 RepID=UPI00260F0BF2|nr:TonB-dependent receptor [uncultured Microbulbifer sp.]